MSGRAAAWRWAAAHTAAIVGSIVGVAVCCNVSLASCMRRRRTYRQGGRGRASGRVPRSGGKGADVEGERVLRVHAHRQLVEHKGEALARRLDQVPARKAAIRAVGGTECMSARTSGPGAARTRPRAGRGIGATPRPVGASTPPDWPIGSHRRLRWRSAVRRGHPLVGAARHRAHRTHAGRPMTGGGSGPEKGMPGRQSAGGVELETRQNVRTANTRSGGRAMVRRWRPGYPGQGGRQQASHQHAA
jgi:hypothetical protein